MKNLSLIFFCAAIGILLISCSKDKTTPTPANVTTLGLYQYGVDSGKRVFIHVTGIGNKSIDYLSVFDTGSAGMTIDAHGILPDSMITSTGIKVTGDSVIINGVTVTSKSAVLSYGNKTALTREYGNLAYASVTIGDQNGKTTSARVPIFLYYKVIDANGTVEQPHLLDVFGVGPGISYANSAITSPLRFFNSSANLTSGFKLATLAKSSFVNNATYVAGLLTIGLTQADISSSGFIMHSLAYSPASGYSPDIPATIAYNGQSVDANILFDTGTPLVSIIENKLAVNTTGALPASTVVTITTNQGFKYTYTTTNISNLTEVDNPNQTGDSRSILGIDFFINNEYLTDYVNHQIGLKNN